MINQLLSLLAFNPSLISQLAFYAKRLKKEQSIRRLGLILIALSMLVQLFVAISPPEKSLASSNTNLLNGVETKTDLIKAWKDPKKDIAAIYSYFGVTLADIEAPTFPNKPNDTIVSNAQDYWSTGRLSLSGFSQIDQKFVDTEMKIVIGPDTTIYMRQLKAWDIKNPSNSYKAFHGKKKDGKDFWIVVDCGNYVQIHKFETPVKPTLEIRKTISPKSATFNPGDKFSFRIEYRNKTPNSLAEDTVLEDQLDLAHFDVLNASKLPIFSNVLHINRGSLGYSSAFSIIDIPVKVKDDVKSGQKICNTAEIGAKNAPKVKSTVCSDVVIPPSDTPPGQAKTVRNLTQNLDTEQAVKSKVKAGDEIEYSLLTTNTSSTDKKDYVVEDYVGDLLDYADLDLVFLTDQGGVFDKTSSKVVWEKQTLKAGSDTIKTFRIKMKDPLPSTNSPSALTTTFDCKISNEFGNELSMDVTCPLVKSIETLPNTGPGSTLTIAFTATAVSAYFFARSRLLAKELDIVRHEQATSGSV